MGIAQSNLKRMLAYSSISQIGFVLLGVLSGIVDGNAKSAPDAYGGALFYIITYVLTTVGSFGLIQVLARKGFECEQISDLRGLNQRSPWMAFVMLILMFSLAGLPPTVGFYAKLSVLQSTVASGQVWLAVLAVMASLVGAFYYLRIVKTMYFDAPADMPAFEAGKRRACGAGHQRRGRSGAGSAARSADGAVPGGGQAGADHLIARACRRPRRRLRAGVCLSE